MAIEQQLALSAAAKETPPGWLTPAGWPRPRVGGWPIPWISPSDELSQTNGARLAAAGTGGVCAVCGEGYQEEEKALLLVNPPAGDERWMVGDVIEPAADTDGVISSIDNGVLHTRCARLALAWCPKLRELWEADDLVCVEVVAHECVAEMRDTAQNGKPYLTATFAEGTIVELPL